MSGAGEDEDDPMRPDAWYAKPGVCGSCIAWRPEDPRPGEEVAAGSCRLRGELGRVPATLRKCDLYKPRGQFVYKPGRVKEPSRRKKASAVRVLKRDESGELKEAQAPRPARRAEPRERPSVPRTVEVGTDDRAILRAVLKELYAEAHPDAGREMHGRFEGGKAKVVQVDGRECAISSEDLFRMLERFRASLEALEDALVSKDALLDQFAEMQKQLRSVQGSMTTFNFLYASRDDYFSGKP